MIINQIAANAIQKIDPISRALSSLSASSLSSLLAKNDELVRSDLEAFRTLFFICLVASTIAVFAGVALEEGEAWMHAIKHVLPLDPITVYRWAKKLVKVGWILIVIGVAGEGIFEVCVTRTDSTLGTFDNILLTEARKEASNAVLGAATANMQVAEANERASINELAEQELKAENLRLEATIAPRSLSLDQQKKIADVCRKFQGHGVLVKSYGMDAEAAGIAGQILALLKSVPNIGVADGRGSIMVSGGFDTGVHVRGPETEHEFTLVLGDALSRIGKLQVAVNDPEPRTGGGMGGGGEGFARGTSFVTVMVGIKPLPTLTAK